MQSLWMLLASAMFAVMGACIKVASDYGASLPHVVLFRGLPSVLLIFLWSYSRKKSLRPIGWSAHIWRNVAGVSSMWLGFYAIAHLPLSTAISLNYTAPLFIATWLLLFGATLRDPVRIIAVAVGFLGVLAILRPSIDHNQWFAGLVGLMAGSLAAVAMMQIRQLGRLGEFEWRTVFYFSLTAVLSSLIALFAQGWAVLSSPALWALIGVGSAGFIGQLAMTRAFGLGSPLLTAALQYSTIIFAALLGYMLWGTVPDILAWGGMLLIIASGLLSIWRTYNKDNKGEASLRKRVATASPSKPLRSNT